MTNPLDNQQAQAAARDVLIAAAIVLAVAALAMATFIWLKSDAGEVQKALSDLEQIKKSAAEGARVDAAGQTTPGLTNQTPDAAATTATGTPPSEDERVLSGVLSDIGDNIITITDKDDKKQAIDLDADVSITYQGEKFDRSRFYLGDQLQITMKKKGGSWLAARVAVVISANPAVPAPVPKTQ